MKNNYYLGLDLGTSSLKGLWLVPGGKPSVLRIPYSCNNVENIEQAVRSLFTQLPENVKNGLKGISVSSQVGTYITDDGNMIPWYSPVGKECLSELKNRVSVDEFIREIGMNHPDINSYPLPMMMYMSRERKSSRLVMPKEYLIEQLTGNYVSDIFSMRGFAHPQKGYSLKLKRLLDITVQLPELKAPTELAGTTTGASSEKFGIPGEVPVYTGCNDFFAGLLGMGVWENGTAFDLTGTSEHFGFISDTICKEAFVSGQYFNLFCSYGGTKSGGSVEEKKNQLFETVQSADIHCAAEDGTPIFLPYVQGERAPIFDEDARGVFFGIGRNTTKENMAYAMTEGCVFGLFNIAEEMKMPGMTSLVCGGGMAENLLYNQIKAEMFGCPVIPATEKHASALGAAILAMSGSGEYSSLKQAMDDNTSLGAAVLPTGEYADILKKRYKIFKNIYRSLKSDFKELREIYGEKK